MAVSVKDALREQREQRNEKARARREAKAKQERENAAADLRQVAKVKPGDTIFCILRHVSRSGMLRVIDLYHQGEWGVMCIGPQAAKALGWRYDFEKDGIRVEGAGMDMGHHLVMQLSYALFRDYTDEQRGFDRNQRQRRYGYELEHRWL